MSVLLVVLPPRPRAGDASAPVAAASGPTSWHYLWSANGRQAERSGRATADLLPRADSLVALLPAADLSWQRITLPRAPANRLRAALAGALEDSLLEDAETLHFALAPQAAPGSETWVAVTNKAWLAAQIAALEAGGRTVDRVVPQAAPLPASSGEATGHFEAAVSLDGAAEQDASLHLLLASGAGCCRLPLPLPNAAGGGVPGALAASSVLRTLLDAGAADTPLRWTASPAAAGAAEAWLAQQGLAGRVELLSDDQHHLAQLNSAWNLRQFELLPQLRGTRAARDVLRRLARPEWRPFRWGLAALVGLQLVGLNGWAWQLNRTVQDKRDEVVQLLKTTHPQVRAVLDAPLQMQRETERLRAASGRAGDGDFETLLAATAAAWPAGQPAAQSLRFENGQLYLIGPGLGPAQADALRERLRGQGLTAQMAENRLRIERMTPR